MAATPAFDTSDFVSNGALDTSDFVADPVNSGGYSADMYSTDPATAGAAARAQAKAQAASQEAQRKNPSSFGQDVMNYLGAEGHNMVAAPVNAVSGILGQGHPMDTGLTDAEQGIDDSVSLPQSEPMRRAAALAAQQPQQQSLAQRAGIPGADWAARHGDDLETLEGATIGNGAVPIEAGGLAFTAHEPVIEPTRPTPVPEAPAPISGGDLRAQPNPIPADEPAAPPGAAKAAAPAAAPVAEPPPRFTPPQAEGATAGHASADQQASRTAVLQDVNDLAGGRLAEVRKSAITGNTQDATTDFQHTQLDGKAGERMKGVLASESNAVRTAAENVTERAGSTQEGVDEHALRGRGQVLADAVGGIENWFDNGIKNLYTEAKAQAGGMPIQKFARTEQLLSDPTNFAGTVEGEALHRGAVQRARTLGLIGQDGLWRPATVEQAELFRQWAGDQFTPRTGRLISQMKDSLDMDVAEHGGAEVFKQARAMRAMKSKLLEEPKGLQKLLGPEDRLGINRQVPIEQIPDYIINLPTDQFHHVVNVLKASAHLGGGELADSAAGALRELKGHMSARLADAGGGKSATGDWDAKGLYKQLNKYSQKMPSVMNAADMRDWKTINDAGNVLRVDRKPGVGGAVLHNTGVLGGLVQKTAKLASSGVGAAAGAHVGGPVGAIVGHVGAAAIEKGAGGIADAQRMRAVESRITKLPERAPPNAPQGAPNAPQGAPNAPQGAPNAPLGAKVAGGQQRGAVGLLRRAPRDVPTVHSPPMLNVGMDVEGGPRLTREQVINEIHKTGAKVRAASVHQSGTEPTVVATLDRELTPSEAHHLSGRLGQQAIAQLDSAGRGDLHGPAAEKWRPFNPDYFMDHSGNPLSAKAPLGARIAGGKQRGAAGIFGKSAPDYFGRDRGIQPGDTMDFQPSNDASVKGFVGEGRQSDAAASLAKSPQDRFMADYDKLPQDPTNPARKRINGNVSVEAARDPTDPDTIHVQHIMSDKPGIGQGGRAMKALTHLADRHGASMTLDSVPQDHPTGTTMPQKGLDNFYMDHGFSKADTGMQRSPDQEPLGARIGGGKQRGAVGDLKKASARVDANVTDEERKQTDYRADTSKKLVDAFHALPDTAEYAAAALAGKAKKGWYADSAKTIANVFGPDSPRFSALLAAMSPQTSVQMNFHNALRTFINWDKAGRPVNPAEIKSIMEQSSLKSPKSKSASNVLPAWVNNAVEALTTKTPEDAKLSGPKVHSFYQNLHNNVSEVTNDAWMSAFAKMDPAKLGGSRNGLGPGKSPTYTAMSAKVREAATQLSHLTGEAWTPREVQETVWSWAKTAYEHADELKGLGTIPELVKHGEITDDLIRSTPDFATLFGSKEHSGFIADSRYAGNAKRLAGAKGKSTNTAGSSEKSAAAEKALRPHLLSAAERLEAVRQERAAAGKTAPGSDEEE